MDFTNKQEFTHALGYLDIDKNYLTPVQACIYSIKLVRRQSEKKN